MRPRGQEKGIEGSTLTHPSGARLSGPTLMLVSPRPPTPEACPPGSKTVEGPLAQPRRPSSQQEPAAPKERPLRYWEEEP